MKKVAVIGSLNVDFFVETNRFPNTGETVLGEHFFKSNGGKGANQAVAAARLGADVHLYGSVGKDGNGKALMQSLKNEDVSLSSLNVVDKPTGVAFIELSGGENRILVVPGANEATNDTYIQSILEELLQFDIFLFQMETPLSILDRLFPYLYKHKKTIILNPAPAHYMNSHLLKYITYMTPNEYEFSIVLKTNDSLNQVLKKYPNKLIVTRGRKGVVYHNESDVVSVPAIEVETLDSTGAGDTFCGAFAVAIAEGKTLYESVTFASAAAGISVTRKGAQDGMPRREELDEWLYKAGIDHEKQTL